MNIPLADRAGAWHILGTTLETGWTVVKAVGWDPSTGAAIDVYNGTGGNFSVAYLVERGGRTAFLKAIDLTPAISAQNMMSKLQEITTAHSFEAKILDICDGARLDRIVVAIESGQISMGPNIQDVVPYLIFELADGDVRKQIRNHDGEVRTAWWLRAMHHTAVGLTQLHSKNISHQDLKPSNVLSFGGDVDFKIADLGRAICDTTAGPYDDMAFAGDMGYAPPEIIYAHINPDTNERRLACDAYLLGSMIFFYVQGMGCTHLLLQKLDKKQWPVAFGGGWVEGYSSALPTLQNFFTEVLEDIEPSIDSRLSAELIKAASELCNPDPSVRGHPLEKMGSGNHFSLVRYVSLFDKLAKKAEIISRA